MRAGARGISAVSILLFGWLTGTLAAQAPADWVAPRTPWGDPDLQGVYNNNNEYGTPFERPDEFTGRELSQITPAELAEIRRTAEDQVIARLPGGRVRGPDDWWLQNLDLTQRSRPWLVVDPADGRIPPLTAAAEDRVRRAGRPPSSFAGGPFRGPEDLGLLERCITRSVPGAMVPVMYSNTYQIVQAPGYVAIVYELVHETRLISLDEGPGETHPRLGTAIRLDLGDARGHWDGDTLVVETTNVSAQSAYRQASADSLRVVERFTRTAPDRVAWSATIDDPATWTRPWSIAMPLVAEPSPLLPFDCHEHNHGLRNILSAARAGDVSATAR